MSARASFGRLASAIVFAVAAPAQAAPRAPGEAAAGAPACGKHPHGIDGSRTPGSEPGGEPRAIDRARGHFPQLGSWFAIVAKGRFDRDSNGRWVPDYGALTHRRVRRADNAGHAILPRFPPTFERALGVADYDRPELGVELEPEGARPARGALEDGVVVYRDAYPDTDVFYKATPTHLDEYLLLRSAAAPTSFRFRIAKRGAIARIVQVAASLEAQDATGRAWLRASPPIAVDRAKRRRTGTLRLEGDVVTLSIDTKGLTYPILVDPDWKSTGDMAHGRFYARALELPSGRVLITGGCEAGVCSGDLTFRCPSPLAQAEALDLDTRTWSARANTVVPRFFHSAELLGDGRVLVAGGCTDADCAAPTAEVEIYDDVAGRFVSTAPLSRARAGAASVRLADGRVLVAGGCGQDSCTPLVDVYDPAGTQVTAGAPMREARGRATATALADGRVLVAGGCTSVGCRGVLASAEIYDPATDAWTLVAPMSTPRAGHAAAHLPDGRVLVAGGCADTACSSALASTESFEPASGTFTAGPPLVEPRFGAAALTLPDGSVLVSQGCQGHTACDLSNELLSAGAFTITAPAITVRAFHELVHVPDRSLVVAIGGCQPQTCSWWNETWDVSAFGGGGLLPDASVPDADAAGGQRCAATVKQVAAGWDHTLAIDTAGALWAWGQNSEGELGTGTKDPTASPALIADDPPFARVCGGSRHSCGVRADGTLWCWGANYEGQLGVGDLASRTVPTQVGGDADWTEIACGGLHTCGLRAGGALWCWGANAVGQLGQGGGPSSEIPIAVASDHRWRALSSTTRHTCALGDDGTLWCWGDNSNGQLGVADTDPRPAPTRVGDSTGWREVGTGALHTCAIDAGSALWCWGANESGQLGTGDTEDRSAPVRVSADGTWTRVDGGFGHTCALRSDRSLYCWGDGGKGQLGTGSVTSTLVPLRADSGVSDLALGYAHTCALSRGVVSCWGDATWGQITGAPGGTAPSPVRACGSDLPVSNPATSHCGCGAAGARGGTAAGIVAVLSLLAARRRRTAGRGNRGFTSR